MRDRWFWILFWASFAIIWPSIIYFSYKEGQVCDEVVFLEGELGIDVRDVDSYDNGMSYLKLCDGKILKVPTRRIIKIVSKEK